MDGLKLTFVGDGNNMANSLIAGCIKMGMSVTIVCPENHKPDRKVVDYGKKMGKLTITDNVIEGMRGADVVYTDVWASMGQEGEAEQRRRDFAGFQVNDDNMAYTKPGCLLLHCLPAHRGEEVTDSCFEAHAKEIFDEAENRLHAQKAILVTLMG